MENVAMKLTHEQLKVREALQLHTQPFRKRALPPSKLALLIKGIPAVVGGSVGTGKSGKRSLSPGAQWADGPPDPFGDGPRVRGMLSPSRATARELRAIEKAITGLHAVAAVAEWRQDIPEIVSAIALLERGYTKLGTRIWIGGAPRRGGKAVDEVRRTRLLALARLFFEIKIRPTTTPDGAYCVTACSLIGVSSIPHNDLKEGIRNARPI